MDICGSVDPYFALSDTGFKGSTLIIMEYV